MLYARRKGSEWRVDERMPDVGPRGRKLCVFVAGTQVLGLAAVIPARSEGEARRAAPYAVEDDVGEAVETVHVALGMRRDDVATVRRVHVVSASQMHDWAERLADAGLQDAVLVAAHSVLPEGDRLFEAGDLVLGRIGARSFALEASVGADVFLGLLDGVDEVAVHGAKLAAEMRLEAVGSGVGDDTALLAQLAVWADDAVLLNLRQGAFQARRAVDLQGVKRWRMAGVLAAMLVIGWFASVVMQTRAMEVRTQALDQRAVQFTEAGWPQAGGDPQRALDTVRGQRGGTVVAMPSALTAISILYDGLEAVPGSELRSVRYDRTRGQVSAVVAFEGFGGVDALSQAIEASGLTVRAGDARQSGAKVIGELTLEAQP